MDALYCYKAYSTSFTILYLKDGYSPFHLQEVSCRPPSVMGTPLCYCYIYNYCRVQCVTPQALPMWTMTTWITGYVPSKRGVATGAYPNTTVAVNHNRKPCPSAMQCHVLLY